jgi:uncharacterized membrane protein SpoIIM required for sporulation
MPFIDERFADHVAPGLKDMITAGVNWTEMINKSNPLASSQIQANNIQVTFYAFAGGVIFGIGTAMALLFNGLHIGVVMGLCVKYKFWAILQFVSGHGVIELSAIFIAGGAGLLLGKALLMPGNLKRIDALVVNGGLAIRLILGCIPMLIIAGLIEGFISPAQISPYYKYTVSAISAILLIGYFLKPDNRKPEEVNA